MSQDTNTQNDTQYEPQEDTPQKAKREGRRIIEEIEVAGREAADRAKDLIEEGNVRRLIFLTAEDKVILEIPLTAGVAAGGAAALLAPWLAAISAVVAFFAKVKIQIVRVEDEDDKNEPPTAE